MACISRTLTLVVALGCATLLGGCYVAPAYPGYGYGPSYGYGYAPAYAGGGYVAFGDGWYGHHHGRGW